MLCALELHAQPAVAVVEDELGVARAGAVGAEFLGRGVIEPGPFSRSSRTTIG